MTISDLDSALSRYEGAIAELEKPKFDVTLEVLIFRSGLQPISPYLWFIVVLYRTQVERVGILSALIARNAVQCALTDIIQIPQEKLITVIELDSRLREQTEFVIRKVELADWSASFNPPKEAWWWFPEPSNHPLDRFDWLWNILTLASLTASFSLVGDIVPRFLSGSPSVLGSLGVAFPSVVTVLTAGGVLTQTGRKLIEPVFFKFGVKKYYWEEIKLGLSLLLFVGLIGFKCSLPKIADCFNKWGYEKYRNGEWSSAMSDYQRAISLDPDNVQAHHKLGGIYEMLQDLDKAKTEYRLAVQGGFGEAFSDLSRFYIQDKKYSEAVSLLLEGLEKTPEDQKSVIYELNKNLGWARLKQKRYPEADAALRDAIDLDPTRVSAHCLLAQALEGRGNLKEARKELEFCFRNTNPRYPEEDEWHGIAKQKLYPQGEK